MAVVFLAAVFVDAARLAGVAFVVDFAVGLAAVFAAVDLAVDLVAVFCVAVFEAALDVDLVAVLATVDLAGMALLVVAAFAGAAFLVVAFFAAAFAGDAFLAAAFWVVPVMAVAVPAEARAAADAVFDSFFCPATISLKFVPALNLGIRVFLIFTV